MTKRFVRVTVYLSTKHVALIKKQKKDIDIPASASMIVRTALDKHFAIQK